MFRFIVLLPDGEVQVVMIGARDLDHAFQQFARDFWRPEMHSAIGIWLNSALVGRVLPGSNADGEIVPFLQEWPP